MVRSVFDLGFYSEDTGRLYILSAPSPHDTDKKNTIKYIQSMLCEYPLCVYRSRRPNQARRHRCRVVSGPPLAHLWVCAIPNKVRGNDEKLV